MMRVVGVVRLSRETDESTSPTRQRDLITKWAELGDHEIVGWAEDLDVSASVHPTQRPQLGPWLRGERGKFDALVAWRIDRISRKTLHLAELAERHRIVSVTESVDTGTSQGKIFAGILATLGEAEREAIKQRTKESFEHLAKVGRHRGGFLPYGYRAEKADAGWRLVIDEEAAAVVKRIIEDVLSGRSINAVCADLNREGVPTSLDHQRILAGKPTKNAKWRMGNLRKLLGSETLRGYMVKDARWGGTAEVVTDDAGMRVRRAPAIVEDDTWERLQKELARRAGKPWERTRSNGSLLLRIAFCPCGERCYVTKGRNGLRYRCASKSIGGASCVHPESGSVEVAWLDAEVEQWFLTHHGGEEAYRVERVEEVSYEAEAREVRDAITRLASRLARMPDGPAADAVERQMIAHQTTLAEIEARPTGRAGTAIVYLGETWGQRWAAADTEGQRGILREFGVTLTVRKAFGRRRAPAVLDIREAGLADDLARFEVEAAAAS